MRPLPFILAFAFVLAAPLRAQGAYDLVLRDVEGDVIVSLDAKNAQLGEIFTDVAARTHKQLVGLERLGEPEPVTAQLDERPLNQVLFTLAGCAGARVRVNPSTIEIFGDLGGGASVEELEEQTTIAYLRALQAHPEHPQGARAELVLGEIQEKHGNSRAAVGHYELVARNFPDSDLVPESLWRAGNLLMRLGEWADATAKFTALANYRSAHVYSSRTRLALARCQVQSGDARQALLLLDALENLYPTIDGAETKSRRFVRALALRGLGRHGEALQLLAEADELGVEPEWELDASELRAEAFEYFERPAEAARAWLKVAQLATGRDRDRAYAHAARLSSVAGDPIAVLMIERAASGTTAAVQIAGYADRAREELGLAAQTGVARLATAIEHAQGFLGAHLPQLAVQELEPVWLDRGELDEPDRARLAAVYARALDESKGIEPALTALRRLWEELRTSAARKDVCVAAGELFEKHERFEDAARAYGGEL